MRLLTLLAVTLCLPTLAFAAEAKSGLTRLLEAEIARVPAKVGMYVKDVRTAEEAGVNADTAFNAMSVAKLPVLIRAFQLADQKKLDLDERIEFRPEDRRHGSGVLFSFAPGLKLALRDYLTQMVITSVAVLRAQEARDCIVSVDRDALG